MRFCTSATLLDLPAVRVLAERLAEHHPGAPLTVLLIGQPALRQHEPFTWVTGSMLGIRGFDEKAARYEHDDLARLLQPHLLQHLLNERDDPLIYLGPWHDLLGPLEFDVGGVILNERVHGGLPEDGRRPDNDDLRTSGRIDPGFVALAPSDLAERFLAWWATRATQLIPSVSG